MCRYALFGQKDGVCKSSTNCVGSALSGSCGTSVSQCSNGITYTDHVVVSAKQVVDSGPVYTGDLRA